MAMDVASSTGEKLVTPSAMARKHDVAIDNSETCCDSLPMPPFILAGHAD